MVVITGGHLSGRGKGYGGGIRGWSGRVKEGLKWKTPGMGKR